MNAAQIHLALNHAPLFLSITGGILLLWGIIRKADNLKTISLYMMIAAALFTIPVFLTGDGTEELVEHLPGVNENVIEDHEEMARISMILIAITGFFSIMTIIFHNKSGVRKYFFPALILLSLVSFGSMAKTAHLGGMIRHQEIQNVAATDPAKGQNEHEEVDDD